MAIPLLWLAAPALRTSFLPYEKIILFGGFALPAFSRVLAVAIHVPLATLVIVLVFWCVARRALIEAESSRDIGVAPAGEPI